MFSTLREKISALPTLLKILIVGVFIVGVALFYLYYHFFVDMSGLASTNDLFLLKSSSPNGTYTIELYRSNAGATVDFAILGKLNAKDSTKSKNIYWAYHESEAKVEWIDDSTVKINNKVLHLPNETYDWRRY